MYNKGLIDIPEQERSALRHKFAHEDALLTELDIYRNKVRKINRSGSVLDLAVLTVYRHHIRNIENLLNRLNEKPRRRAEPG